MSENLPYHEQRRLRKAGLLPALPTKKEKKYLNKISPKRRKENEEAKALGNDLREDEYFEYWMKNAIPRCENCGMEAYWLLEKQKDEKKQEAYRLIWRACQAHVLPKKKTYGFPSLRNNLDNHLVLFPSWGGLLCGCHGWFDSSWYNASTMEIWPKAIEIFKTKLYGLIPEKELKNIPEILLQTLKN